MINFLLVAKTKPPKGLCLQVNVGVAATTFRGSATLACSAALAGAAVILVGIPASALAGVASARSVLRATAILSPGGIVIVCHDLGELLQLGVAP